MIGVGYVLVKWVGTFWWVFEIVGLFGGYIWLARDWNLHIINSQLVGAIVGVSWSWILHDMSGFKYHWLEWLMVCLQSLHSVDVVTILCLFVLWLCYAFWFGLFVCSVIFLYMILHGIYMVWGLWDIFWWGSYSSVYVLPPMFVFPIVLIMYIHVV